MLNSELDVPIMNDAESKPRTHLPLEGTTPPEKLDAKYCSGAKP